MRYGFILADTYTGASVDIEMLASSLFPDSGNDILFFFSGGRLSKETGTGMLRNSVYEFARKENIDSAVVWMSSLTGDLNSDEALNRLTHLKEVPYVTLSGKTDRDSANPDITFDAYSGMKALVSHCIEKHGASHIAFIRGPENHISSAERYRGYLDALEEHGIQVDAKLISSPVDWSCGDVAAEQLISERKLTPVKDFDLIVCASDYMLHNALKKTGILCGDQSLINLHYCGFNDGSDARKLSVPCSTVSLPFEEMVCNAFAAMKDLISGKPVKKNIILKTFPVYRKSCGCLGLHTETAFDSAGQFFDFVSSLCGCDYANLENCFVRACETCDDKDVRNLTQMLCVGAGDYYYTNEVIEMIPSLSFLDENQRTRLYRLMRYILPEEMGRLFRKKTIAEQELQEKLDHFKSELLETNTLREVAHTLRSTTAEIGIDAVYLVINRQENQVLITETDSIEFSNGLVLPEAILKTLSPGSYTVSPLFTEEEVHGHLVIKTKQRMGRICEEIRSAVSSTVKSSLLFEQISASKKLLEKAEYDRLRFFSGINSDLRDPLSQISEIIDETAEMEETSRQRIHKALSQTNRIVDLALNSIGELNTNFQIVDISQLLRSVKGFIQTCELPCMFIDPARLYEALSCLTGEESVVSAQPERSGLVIRISRSLSEETDNYYANEIILLHGGSVKHTENGCDVVLPYPSLSNRTAEIPANGTIACFGRKSVDFSGMSEIIVDSSDFIAGRKLSSDTGLIVWGRDFFSSEAAACLGILENDNHYSSLPIVVFGLEWAQTLPEAFSKTIGLEKHRILVSGNLMQGSCCWLADASVISCDTDNLATSCIAAVPSMVMTSDYDGLCSDLRKIRSNDETSGIPVVIVTDCIDSTFISRIQEIPKVMICDRRLLDNESIQLRISAILRGAEMLPVFSGTTVKKVQVFFSNNYMNPISRWQVAEAVHVSEDYLTSIFKKEIGISPWDYLNRYRIEIAAGILQSTGASVAEVAHLTGFQGQSYFCTVFKKIKGFSPSLLRKR